MEKFKPWIGSLVLLPVVLWLTFNAGDFIFLLDHFNLLIHEGGHGVFRIFGKFIYTLGGSLMQVLMPLLFVYYFVSHRQRFGTQISLVWLGQNLMNVSVYAADAVEQRLPLLGGNKVYHDWNYLLRDMGILQYDNEVGAAIFYTGIVFFVIALLIPLFMKDYSRVKIDLNL